MLVLRKKINRLNLSSEIEENSTNGIIEKIWGNYCWDGDQSIDGDTIYFELCGIVEAYNKCDDLVNFSYKIFYYGEKTIEITINYTDIDELCEALSSYIYKE